MVNPKSLTVNVKVSELEPVKELLNYVVRELLSHEQLVKFAAKKKELFK